MIEVTDAMLDLGQLLLEELGKNEMSERETIKQMFVQMYEMAKPVERQVAQQRSSASVSDTHRQRLKGLLIDFEVPFKGHKGGAIEMMEHELVFHFDQDEKFFEVVDKRLL
jgi:hypothetical protein